MEEKGRILPIQLEAPKKEKNLENLTPYTLMTIINKSLEEQQKSKRVSFTEKRLNKFFPEDYSAAKREKIIIE